MGKSALVFFHFLENGANHRFLAIFGVSNSMPVEVMRYQAPTSWGGAGGTMWAANIPLHRRSRAPGARHFFHFLRPKCLNWGVLCNFNPRQGIPIISQAFGIRGATWSIIARRGIALDRKTLPTWGHFFHFLRPKWLNWGGFRSFCAISIQEGVFNSYVKQLACEGQCDTWLS